MAQHDGDGDDVIEYNIAVVGAKSCGKTALIMRYTLCALNVDDARPVDLMSAVRDVQYDDGDVRRN